MIGKITKHFLAPFLAGFMAGLSLLLITPWLDNEINEYKEEYVEEDPIISIEKYAETHGCPNLLESLDKIASDPIFSNAWIIQRKAGSNKIGAYIAATSQFEFGTPLKKLSEDCSSSIVTLITTTNYQNEKLP